MFDGSGTAGGEPGGDFTQAEFPLSQDTTFGDSSQGLSFTNESVVDQTLFAGDGLVAQPNKVRFSPVQCWRCYRKAKTRKLRNSFKQKRISVDGT